MSDTPMLLWEVGCEELPAWACDAIERQLPKLVADAVVDARLDDPDASLAPLVWVGPRRFSVLVPVRSAQRAVREEARGPAVRAAFVDGVAGGEPTRAGAGFARSRGMDVAELEIRTVDGSEFVFAVRDLPCASIDKVWPGLADSILASLQFAKPMRWGSGAQRFVRPIRWMVTLHGDRELTYDCCGVTSTRTTRTHRFLDPEREREIPAAGEYAAIASSGSVVVDQAARRTAITAGLDEAAAALGGAWSDPGGVLREVVHLVEHPTVITGSFDERYLQLPERVLVTAMQSHQRYLPVERDGSLAPAFLTVMNADPRAIDSILPGYERVLAGRLDDAVFSFERDRTRGLDDMATDASLGAVVFHADAGSLAARRDRIAHVAAALAEQLGVDPKHVADAARLAKADQVSGVVQEFAELEGFAGSLYAAANGYPADVCAAIDQQFLPRGLDSALPDQGVPAVLALADKLELLATMFAIGEQPTGSRDPHGLRRAAIGVVRIILEHDLPVEIASALDAARAVLVEQSVGDPAGAVMRQLHEFLMDRVEKRLVDDGVRKDAVRAAIAADLPLLQHDVGLARALDHGVRGGSPAFMQVLEAHERARKLLAKAQGADAATGADAAPGSTSAPLPEADPSLFEVESERALHAMLQQVAPRIQSAVAERRFDDAVSHAATLGPAVAAFFARDSGVMVMADDERLRRNRLALLQQVLVVAEPLGDLAQLQT